VARSWSAVSKKLMPRSSAPVQQQFRRTRTAGGPQMSLAVGGHAHCAETHAAHGELAELQPSGRCGRDACSLSSTLFGCGNGPQIRLMSFEALRVLFSSPPRRTPRSYDHVLARLPVHRRRHRVFGVQLERIEQAQDLVEIAARASSDRRGMLHFLSGPMKHRADRGVSAAVACRRSRWDGSCRRASRRAGRGRRSSDSFTAVP